MHIHIRSFNFNRIRTRTYNRRYFFVRVCSLRNRVCSCSLMFVRLKPKRIVHEHKRIFAIEVLPSIRLITFATIFAIKVLLRICGFFSSTIYEILMLFCYDFFAVRNFPTKLVSNEPMFV
ncbi:hypothetical protein Hanom_Chr11g00971361 [Helianthus anomalus]